MLDSLSDGRLDLSVHMKPLYEDVVRHRDIRAFDFQGLDRSSSSSSLLRLSAIKIDQSS